MNNIYLAQVMMDDDLREVEKNRLVKIANRSRKIRNRQRLVKLASRLGLIQRIDQMEDPSNANQAGFLNL